MELGRYQILRPLGQGGMATVYLGEDPLLNRLVAIKVIQSHLSSNEKLIARFTVEAKTIAALRHVNIVEIFDFGVQENQQFLVMEYIDGQSLQTICTAMTGRPMPDTVAAAIIYQAAEGLTSAERHGVVHRDIKPENLLFNSAGVLKITDFGIAHIADEQSRTQTGAVLGSPNFMSPEQVEGLKPTHTTDLFSLGGVFYSCLTGRMPFTGNSIPATLRNICEKPHAPVAERNPDADPVLIQIVDTLLQKAPADRGEGARWLAHQLRDWLNSHGIVDPVEHVHSFVEGLSLPSSPTQTGSKFLGIDLPRFGSIGGISNKSIFSTEKTTWIWITIFGSLAAVVIFFWLFLKHNNPPPVAAPPNSGIAETSVLDSGIKAHNPAKITGDSKSGSASGNSSKTSGKRTADSSSTSPAQPGAVLIESAPPFAAINVDGKAEGETPMKTWLELPPGKHHLELVHRLAPPFDTDIVVSPGSRRKFKFKLER